MDFSRDPITSFLAGRSILITGATGFLGKVLLEKIIRSTPDVGTIFLLVRPKRKLSAAERVATMLEESRAFTRLREAYGEAWKGKVVAIGGDVGEAGLGMSAADRARVVRECEVVLHLAATVDFNAPIKKAFRLNVGGLRGVLEVCAEIEAQREGRLAVFVHVSTCYVNALHYSGNGAAAADARVTETIEPLSFDYVALEERLRAMSEEEARTATPALLAELGGWPNTYTLSKRVAEELLERDPAARRLPIVVVRPSIICAALREPMPGWVDSLIGPSGLILAAWLGAVHVYKVDPGAIFDLIPVDYVSNAILVAAWSRASRGRLSVRDEERGLSASGCVVAICSSVSNPVTFNKLQVLQAMILEFEEWQSPKRVAPCYGEFVVDPLEFAVKDMVLHTLPALLVDAALLVTGRTPFVLKSKFAVDSQMVNILRFFTEHEWRFDATRMEEMLAAVPPAHRDAFACDARLIQWDVLFLTMGVGMKQFLLNEWASPMEAWEAGKAGRTQRSVLPRSIMSRL
jgi:fatty acyl-CoA reductase